MKFEQTAAGLEAQLKINGIGRFISAGFLAFWLTGWAAGECFALWILGYGAYSLLTGQPLTNGQKPLEGPGVFMVGGFLLFWLTLWTIGGIAAGRQVLRLLAGRDRIRIDYEGLEIEHSYGLFRSVERVARSEIRRFYRASGSAALNVETAVGTKTITRLGTPGERAEMEQALNREFCVQAEPETAGALPKTWSECLSLERDSVLVKDPSVRRKQARVAWIICAALSFVPVYLVSTSSEQPNLLGAVIVFSAFAIAAGWGAIWLSFGRSEWRLDKGRLVLQRRFGHNRKIRFEATSLELYEDNSGDGGPSYVLVALAPSAPVRTASYPYKKHRRTIQSQTDDPTEPRNLGLWLSQRCQMPFADLTTQEAKAKDIEALKQHLANSGRAGRAALWIVERLAPSSSKEIGGGGGN